MLSMQLSMCIIAIIAYSEMENSRTTDETESSEARMARSERTVEMLTEALRLQQQN